MEEVYAHIVYEWLCPRDGVKNLTDEDQTLVECTHCHEQFVSLLQGMDF